MRVRHHLRVEKERFKKYSLEFLMIFLAMTLGFSAENLREKNSDSNKETKSIKSVVQDLSLTKYHAYLFKEDKKKARLLIGQIQMHYHLKAG